LTHRQFRDDVTAKTDAPLGTDVQSVLHSLFNRGNGPGNQSPRGITPPAARRKREGFGGTGLKNKLHLTPEQTIGWLNSVNGLGGVLAAIAYIFLAKRASMRRLLTFAVSTSAARALASVFYKVPNQENTGEPEFAAVG
jgi:hypothetical protein